MVRRFFEVVERLDILFLNTHHEVILMQYLYFTGTEESRVRFPAYPHVEFIITSRPFSSHPPLADALYTLY